MATTVELFVNGIPIFIRWVVLSVLILIATALLVTGHAIAVITVVLVGAAIWLMITDQRWTVLGRSIRAAALPIFLLGLFPVLGWISGIIDGGVTGDTSRGFLVGGLAIWTVVLGLVFLLRYDKPVAVVAIVLVPTLILIPKLAIEVAGLLGSGIGQALLLFGLLLGLLILLPVWLIVKTLKTTLTELRNDTTARKRLSDQLNDVMVRPTLVVVGLILATYWVAALLFGDPQATSKVGLTIWLDGRFDQAGYGVLLMMLAIAVAFLPEPRKPLAKAEPCTDLTEEERAFSANLLEKEQREWCKVPSARREQIMLLYEKQLQKRVLSLTNVRFLATGLRAADVTTAELNAARLSPQTYLKWAKRKFIAAAIDAGARKTGRIPKTLLKAMGVKNAKILEELRVEAADVKKVIAARHKAEAS